MDTFKIYNNMTKLPFGKWLFGKTLGFLAPYFSTIKPKVEILQPGKGVITIKDRRQIRNHLGSIHAAALCNLAELAGGLTLDVTLDKKYRWIPMGMNIQYLKKGHGTLTATCVIDEKSLSAGETSVQIQIQSEAKEMISKAEIFFNIKAR